MSYQSASPPPPPPPQLPVWPPLWWWPLFDAPQPPPTRPQPYRFSREVDWLAPKPGHLLGHFGYTYRGDTASLAVVEGPRNNTAGIAGQLVQAGSTTVHSIRFGLAGEALRLLHDFPVPVPGSTTTLEFDGVFSPFGSDFAAIPFPMTGATLHWSGLRSADRAYPDGAILVGTMANGDTVTATLSGYREGWEPLCWGVVVVIGLCALSGCDDDQKKKKETVEKHWKVDALTPEGKFSASGGSTTTTEYGDPDKPTDPSQQKK